MKRYGLIGCGMMGREHLANLALLDGAEVRALYDPRQDLAQAAQQLAPGAGVEADLAALLARNDLDALVIASPNHLHMSQLHQICQHPPRPVLIEKPLFIECGDGPAARALADSYQAQIWVAMEYRYMPVIAQFRERLSAVTGGPVMLSMREYRFPFLPKIDNWNRFNAQTGGTLVEKCCHFFDLMRLLLQAEAVQVMASGGQSVNHKDEVVDGQPPDIWDNAYVVVDFDNGSRAMLELCMFAEGGQFQEELTALGPNGTLSCQVPGPARFWPAEAGPAPVARLTEAPRQPKAPVVTEVPVDPAVLAAGDHNGATYYQHQRFLQVVQGAGPVDVTVDDGVRAVEIGLAAQRAALTGQVVRL